ncbi:MAG: large subunit ribosomal protein [Patescibacteria group bacterium]|nr:large subunit ribosomal protein [Patescibacteria group bacterium]
MATKKTTTEEKKDAGLIIAPRITEKASQQSSANAYTFVVKKNATKHTLAAEIKKTYKVTPIAISILNVKGKKVFSRGKFGRTEGLKKAIVFLKKGDSIAIAA